MGVDEDLFALCSCSLQQFSNELESSRMNPVLWFFVTDDGRRRQRVGDSQQSQDAQGALEDNPRREGRFIFEHLEAQKTFRCAFHIQSLDIWQQGATYYFEFSRIGSYVYLRRSHHSLPRFLPRHIPYRLYFLFRLQMGRQVLNQARPGCMTLSTIS